MNNNEVGILSYKVAGVQSFPGKYTTKLRNGHTTLKTLVNPMYTKAVRRRTLTATSLEYYASKKSRPMHSLSKKEWGRMSKKERLFYHLEQMGRDDGMIGDFNFEII